MEKFTAKVIDQTTPLSNATVSLLRMQDFDVNNLSGLEYLVNESNFVDAFETARRLASLYKRLSTTALEDFPDARLEAFILYCNFDYLKLTEMTQLAFNRSPLTPECIEYISGAYDRAFDNLISFISYPPQSSANLQRLNTESQSILQQIKNYDKSTRADLKKLKENAENILKGIRETASEVGVTQQSIHFQTESTNHNTDAKKWGNMITGIAFILSILAIASIFLHKWQWLAPTNSYETIQFIISKLLIFSILTYLLILSAKNYLNHKHNSIVNKHRQNALMTYKAMVGATNDSGSREAILIQAASCIFNPQPTGYTASSDVPVVSGKSIVEILSKPVVQAAAGSNK